MAFGSGSGSGSGSGVVFGLPVMTTDFTEAYDKAMELPYSVYSIQYKYFEDKTSSHPFTEFYHFNNTGAGAGSPSGSSGSNNLVTHRSNSNSNSNSNDDSYTVHVNKYNDKPPTTTEPIKQKPVSSDIYKVFFIKPDLQNDIYYLYQISTTNFDVISKEIAHTYLYDHMDRFEKKRLYWWLESLFYD
jgi:hypothetical protein